MNLFVNLKTRRLSTNSNTRFFDTFCSISSAFSFLACNMYWRSSPFQGIDSSDLTKNSAEVTSFERGWRGSCWNVTGNTSGFDCGYESTFFVISVTSSSFDFDVSFVTISGSPRIFDQPVWNFILSSPSNSKNLVVCLFWTEIVRIFFVCLS